MKLLAADDAPIALVGHSLGGLLLRDAITSVPELNVHRVIMFGTPNRPPRRAPRAMNFAPFRWCGRRGPVACNAEGIRSLYELVVRLLDSEAGFTQD